MATMMLTVEPAYHGRKGTRYRVMLDNGETLLEGARLPFFDGARELLKRGFDPATVLEARHKGSSMVALRSTIGRAAGLTVREDNRVGPIIRPWTPFPESR